MRLRRAGVAAALLVGSACNGGNEAAEVKPVPDPTREHLDAGTTTTTGLEATTTTEPASESTTTTEPPYDWGPVLCEGVGHPDHHEPCVGTRARTETASSLADSPSGAQREEPAYTPIRVSSDLAAIRECESGGNYSTDTGNGYYGAYQFDQPTWESVGGSGNPANASPAEQDSRAAMLQDQRGNSPWPTCG